MQFETSYVFNKKLTAEQFTAINLAIEWPCVQRGDEMLEQNPKIIHKRVTAPRMNFKKRKKGKMKDEAQAGVWVLARKGERLPQRLSIVVLLCLSPRQQAQRHSEGRGPCLTRRGICRGGKSMKGP